MIHEIEMNETPIYQIHGTMLGARFSIPFYQWEQFDPSFFKEQLANEISKHILQSNMCEFTKMKDPVTEDVIVTARVVLLPDTQVRVIREKT